MDYSVSVFCVIFRSKNKKFKKFVLGLLRSNDPKVAVMPATAIPADYLIQLIAAPYTHNAISISFITG